VCNLYSVLGWDSIGIIIGWPRICGVMHAVHRSVACAFVGSVQRVYFF
jgi:hypothetical protein